MPACARFSASARRAPSSIATIADLSSAPRIVPPAAAKDGVHATLTTKRPTHASQGTKLIVTFTLHDRSGHPFNASGVFVKVICPTKDASSIAFATSGAHPGGRYRVVATVPP